MDTARRSYGSREYQEILHLRTDNVISDLILVDPVGRDFTSAEWAGEIRTAIAAGSDGRQLTGTRTEPDDPAARRSRRAAQQE